MYLNNVMSELEKFVESDKDLDDKIGEDMTGGLSKMFTRKAVVAFLVIRH